MNRCLRFCYKIDKAAEISVNEYGDYEESYMCCKAKGVKSYLIDKKKYRDLQNAFKKMLASQIGVNEKLITSITLNEYLDNTEEEEDE